MADTLYELLEVSPTASADEITAAYYRQRAKLAAAGERDDLAIADANQLLDEAYRTLSDPAMRASYDRRLGLGPPATERALVPMPALLQPATLADVAPGLATADKVCGNCGALNPAGVTTCVLCGAQIGRPCPRCGHTIALMQPVCHHCGTPINEYDRQRFGEGLAIEQRVQAERREAQAYSEALGRTNRADARNTAVFWLVAAFGCMVITLLAYLALQYFNGAF